MPHALRIGQLRLRARWLDAWVCAAVLTCPGVAAADKAEDKPKAAEKTEKKAEKPERKAKDAGEKSSAGKGAAGEDKSKGAAKQESAAGPRQGSGVRKAKADDKPRPALEKKESVREAEAKKDEPAPKPKPARAKKSGRKAHQKGPKPRRPKSALPEGVEESKPNPRVRRAIAGGTPLQHADEPIADDEIRALLEADRVLFSKPLEGATPGWSWGISQKSPGPQVSASGVPPSTPGTTEDKKTADAAWLRSLTMPNLPVRLDARVVKYLKFYRDNKRGRAIAKAWAKKSGRYTPALKAEIAKAGLPTDLVWLSLIESGHNPNIFSHAGAAGLWQFIPESGRMYGLTVDRWVDERLDPRRSTQAAIAYLSDLYKRFGNWELAMAAYNMGHGGLQRAIRKYNTNDFWELSRYEAGIPWETSLYVPKIAAIAIVMNNKAAFGIHNVKADAPVSFDTVLVPSGVSLERVAQVSGASLDQLKQLNAQFLSGRTPPSGPKEKVKRWRVHVPRGKGAKARTELARDKAHHGNKLQPYVVRFGDTIEDIAREQGWSENVVRRLNKVGRYERLAAGTVLLVPTGGQGKAAKEEVVVVPPRPFSYPKRRRVFYRVLRGDTVDLVAQAFGVKPSEVKAWNALDDTANLMSGMALQLFVKRTANLRDVRVVEKPKLLVAGSSEFFAHFEGQKGRQRIRIKVQKGDSLSKIAKRYGVSVGWLERINRISRYKTLKIGQTLIVYAKAKASGDKSGARVDRKPLPEVKAAKPEALPGKP